MKRLLNQAKAPAKEKAAACSPRGVVGAKAPLEMATKYPKEPKARAASGALSCLDACSSARQLLPGALRRAGVTREGCSGAAAPMSNGSLPTAHSGKAIPRRNIMPVFHKPGTGTTSASAAGDSGSAGGWKAPASAPSSGGGAERRAREPSSSPHPVTPPYCTGSPL